MEGKIYAAINAVMSEIGAIGKEKKNQQQGFMYRGIDDVMNALNPAFIKHKVFAVPEVLEQSREERLSSNNKALIYSICRVKYAFYTEDGSHVDVVTVGEGMDSGDKASNKAMAIAFKYACFQLFCIPTEEMVKDDARPMDPDGESHELAAKSSKGKPNKPKSQPRKITDEQLQNLYNECGRTGQNWKGVCATYYLKALSDMNEDQYADAMKRFKKLPDKPKKKPDKVKPVEPDPETVPPEDIKRAQGKKLRLKVVEWKEKRSLDANAYYWQLLSRLAEALGISKPRAHNLMLRKYGQPATFDGAGAYFRIPDTDKAEEEALEASTYHIRPTSQVVSGTDGINYRTYVMLKGSSEYDTREMSKLIDGLISDCKEQEIETLPPAEIERMLQAYEKGRRKREKTT